MPKSGKRGSNPGGILSTQEVATVLGISPPTLLKFLKERKIPEPQRMGSSRHWNSADIQHAKLALQRMCESGEFRPKGARR